MDRQEPRQSRRSSDNMLQAAQLHYVDGLSQKQVARRMQVHPATVSRLLRQAHKAKLIHVSVALPGNTSLQGSLARALQRSCPRIVIVKGSGEGDVALAAAEHLLSIRAAVSTLLVDGGRLLAEVARRLPAAVLAPLAIVPIAGSPPALPFGATEIAIRFSMKCLPEASCIRLPTRTTAGVQDLVYSASQLAQKADTALLSVVPWAAAAADLMAYQPEALHEPERLGIKPVAACAGCVLDQDGRSNALPTDNGTECVRSLSYEQLQRLARSKSRRAILCASGESATVAVLAALRSRVCNTLIVDQSLAQSLLLAVTTIAADRSMQRQ